MDGARASDEHVGGLGANPIIIASERIVTGENYGSMSALLTHWNELADYYYENIMGCTAFICSIDKKNKNKLNCLMIYRDLPSMDQANGVSDAKINELLLKMNPLMGPPTGHVLCDDTLIEKIKQSTGENFTFHNYTTSVGFVNVLNGE